MSKSRLILAKVLEIVSYEADITVDKIMSKCGETEVVDARWICAKLLKDYGFYTSKIADLMKITPRYVQYILSDFEDRLMMCKLMRTNYENSKKKIGNIRETMN